MCFSHRRHKMINRLLNKEANANAVRDDGVSEVHLTIKRMDIDMFSFLLGHDVHITSTNNFELASLHLTC